ncbi:MAG: hypothetical protein J1E95_11285 [Muribaculaceae bacterium]|nr:hypothetical protein [Muribaculaceae bacterium]
MILGTMGLGTIDENLQNLISHMSTFPESSLLGVIQNWAKIIGLCIALGVGSFECWMMMLGKRGMDVMKILHIIIISLCISSASWICEAAAAPGKSLGDMAYEMAQGMNDQVAEKEKDLADKQQEYSKKLREIITKAYEEEKSVKPDDGEGSFLGITEAIDEFKKNAEIRIKQATLSIETSLCEWISIAIRFIGEVFFQIVYYGMLVAQNIFMHLLAAFCPIAFAMSLAPPFRSAWSQWLSKYLSLSLWAFVIYMVLYYVDFIMQYNLLNDIAAYDKLINDSGTTSAATGSMGEILMLGMQGLGTTCMYVVGLLVGVFVMKFVPDVCSWLIPGGVGSPIGGAAVGVAMGGASMAAGVAGAAATGGASLAGAIGSQAGRNLQGPTP